MELTLAYPDISTGITINYVQSNYLAISFNN